MGIIFSNNHLHHQSGLRQRFTQMWALAWNRVLPPHCILCGQPSGTVSLCLPCKQDLPWSGPQCQRCALPLSKSSDRICGRCSHKPPVYSQTLSPLQYLFPVNHLVQGFKFNRQLVAGRVLSQLLCEFVIQQNNPLPDMLIPVPLHHFRMARRGYNQAYELASYASKKLDISLCPSALRRSRYTSAQSGLSRKQRRSNVRGAFYWSGRQSPARHVALIDDVMTTGTTASECSKTLKNAGAKQVDVWVTARAIQKS